MREKFNVVGKFTRNLKHIDVMTIIFFGVIIFSLFGFINARYGIHNYEEVKVAYKENSNINYKVYLKENNFFENPYLEENKTYITSLIDYLDINFKYLINTDEHIKGQYSYYVKGIISANKLDNSDNSYWTKEYILTDKITKEYTESDKIEISENIKIKYDDYNNLLTSFKTEYGLSMDGNLKVVLVISNIVNNHIVERDILKETNLELNIPLTSLTIEVPIKTDGVSSEGLLIDEVIYDNNFKYLISKIIGYIFFSLAFVLIMILIYFIVKEAKKESVYHKKLRKILKTYDGIIVSIKEFPNLNNLNIIVVNSFEELIDAHSEIRKPIHYIQKNNGATFVLINEGIAYKYFLERKLFSGIAKSETR